jgi:hypothetical protein
LNFLGHFPDVVFDMVYSNSLAHCYNHSKNILLNKWKETNLTLNFHDGCRFKIAKAVSDGAAVFASVVGSHFVKVNADDSSRRVYEINVMVWTHGISILEPVQN